MDLPIHDPEGLAKFTEAFVKTCYYSGLTIDQTEALYRKAYIKRAYNRSEAFRRGFERELSKDAAGGFDMSKWDPRMTGALIGAGVGGLGGFATGSGLWNRLKRMLGFGLGGGALGYGAGSLYDRRGQVQQTQPETPAADPLSDPPAFDTNQTGFSSDYRRTRFGESDPRTQPFNAGGFGGGDENLSLMRSLGAPTGGNVFGGYRGSLVENPPRLNIV